VVTLLTDVGWAYAAQMKGVLLRDLPSSRVVDLVHDLPAHGIEEAAFLVRSIGRQFPAGTIHVVVVDPGVGGRRRPVILQCGDGSCLVGPDNGVLSLLSDELGGAHGFQIDPARLRARPRVGATFDGRDLFAPAAGRLARGDRPSQLGAPVQYRHLRLPRPRRTRAGASGTIVHIDHFGNLITNLPGEWVPDRTRTLAVLRSGGRSVTVPFRDSYEEIGAGRAGALVSSFGTLELAVGRGRADRRFRARVAQPVRVRWGARGGRRRH